jgi:hypothetical protein
VRSQEDLQELGFSTDDSEYARISSTLTQGQNGQKEREGFIGGTHVKRRPGGKGIFEWFE